MCFVLHWKKKKQYSALISLISHCWLDTATIFTDHQGRCHYTTPHPSRTLMLSDLKKGDKMAKLQQGMKSKPGEKFLSLQCKDRVLYPLPLYLYGWIFTGGQLHPSRPGNIPFEWRQTYPLHPFTQGYITRRDMCLIKGTIFPSVGIPFWVQT